MLVLSYHCHKKILTLQIFKIDVILVFYRYIFLKMNQTFYLPTSTGIHILSFMQIYKVVFKLPLAHKNLIFFP